ncbi:MAG: LacI family DNA-binding transcriptional regulator [Desulfobacterales bacterium]|nr:LacI family DNA-binding transcriptional regulator [Desulfobacterales bacterium]
MDIPQTTHHFRAAFRFCFRNSDFESQKAVADAANVSPSTVSEIMTKKSYSPKTQAKIAKAFGFGDLIDFLALGRKVIEGQAPVATDDRSLIVRVQSDREKEILESRTEDYRGIPLYESGKLAAGENGLVFDPYEQPASTVVVSLRELFGRMHHNLIGMRVGGPSMNPVIPQGSVVVIDLDDKELVSNKIYAVNYPENGENIAAVKRVQKWKHGFVLLSCAPEYPPDLSELEWRDLCVGRAVWVWRKLEDI